MIIAIVGPTGVGKTKLSIELAKIYNGEIINADSLQIYKGLDIGTAKITNKEKGHIPHHLLDIKEIDEEYTVYDYQKDARNCIAKIKDHKKIPILVGGTGFYLKSALYDYNFPEDKEGEENQYEKLTDNEISEAIEKFECGFAYDKKNHRRMIRILNRLEKGYIPDNKDFTLLYPDVIFIGLTASREVLYQRINERFDNMLVPLIDEVKPFIIKGTKTKPLMTGIGYKEFYSFFENKKTLQEVVEECKKNSRNYAKRQYTWFQNQMNIKWFTTDYDDFKKTIDNVVEYIETKIK